MAGSDSMGRGVSDLLSFEQALAGRRILVTGHTGFTGSWACLWLHEIGAQLAGLALAPETDPSLFTAARVQELVPTTLGDICDEAVVRQAIERFQPELVLHLAAQPLVRRSYREPVRTFAVNAMGTAHVLEAARHVRSVKGVLCITTDKVYRNNEWEWPYRENDPLGGKDPYSASKSAAEMVIASYAASYPFTKGEGPAVAIARGGNIIGGGDWSEDRLVPDFVRAVTQGTTLVLRYPDATRPWQHVLGLVHGYMMLMAGLVGSSPAKVARAWNLGPHDPKSHSVREVLEMLSDCWQRPSLDYQKNAAPEAGALALDSSLARNALGWTPAWSTEQSVAQTAAWYRAFHQDRKDARQITLEQIRAWRQACAG